MRSEELRHCENRRINYPSTSLVWQSASPLPQSDTHNAKIGAKTNPHVIPSQRRSVGVGISRGKSVLDSHVASLLGMTWIVFCPCLLYTVRHRAWHKRTMTQNVQIGAKTKTHVIPSQRRSVGVGIRPLLGMLGFCLFIIKTCIFPHYLYILRIVSAAMGRGLRHQCAHWFAMTYSSGYASIFGLCVSDCGRRNGQDRSLR